MKKWILALLCPLLTMLHPAWSQTYDTTTFYGKMNYTFANLDKSQITTGILRDYGIDFQNPDNYTGATLHDSNWVNLDDWRTLYATLYTGQINTNAAMLGLDTINKIISHYASDTLPIAFVGLYYNYQVLDTNAATEGLITVSDGLQLSDVAGRTQSPYLPRSSFAVAPVLQALNAGTNTFIFRSDLFFGNTGKTISAIQVDPTGTGNSYTAVSLNTPFTLSYADSGLYPIIIKVSYTDGTINYGHTKFAVYGATTTGARYAPYLPPHKGSGPPLFEAQPFTPDPVVGIHYLTATKSYLNVAAMGDFTVQYAPLNTSLQRPLIVVEGFDPNSNSPNYPYNGYTIDDYLSAINFDPNSQSGISLNSDLNSNNYDLIFVHWKNGTDFIERNAYLLEDVINYVNANKTPYNGVMQQNVIVGLSMGGLCVRYALRDMEMNNVSHDCRLFISHDAPHWGANVPVGITAMVQELGSWKISNLAPVGLGALGFTVSFSDFFPAAIDGVSLFNSPAAKEMLIQRYTLNSSTGSLTADNSAHATFQTELQSMGWPVNCRNVTISNGVCNGSTAFSNGAQFIGIQGNTSMGTYFGQLWRSLAFSLSGELFPAIHLFTNGSVPLNDVSLLIQFPLGLFTSSASVNVNFGSWAIPNSGSTLIYQGDVYIKRKILFFTVTSYLLKCHSYSSSDMLPLDNAPGGQYDMDQFVDINAVNSQLQSNLGSWVHGVVSQSKFCFVPTVSALDLSNAQSNLFTNVCSNINCLNPSGVADYYVAPANQDHITYTQANGNWMIQELDPSFNCAKYCPTAMSISGDAILCSATSNPYTITSLPANSTVAWSVDPVSYATVNTPNATQTTLTPTYAGALTLTANLSNGCASSTATLTKALQEGVPTSPLPVADAAGNCYYNVEVYVQPGVTGIQYSTDDVNWSGVSFYTNASCSCVMGRIASTVEGPVTLTYWTRAEYNTTCGYSTPQRFTVNVPAPKTGSGCAEVVVAGDFTAAPNPAKGTVTITAQNTAPTGTTNATVVSLSSIKKVSLFSTDGRLVKEYAFPTASTQVTIDVSGLASGAYFLKVENPNGSIMKSLLIRH